MDESIRETRLENGLTILSDTMPGVRSVTLGFFFRMGSRHEPKHLNGITHFLEHAVFKGSAKRTAVEIAEEQDRLGGTLDAFTTHEETGFVIKVVDNELPRAFDLLSDMVLKPRLAEADLESEQRVIIEEMKMIEDSPEDYLGDIFNEAFFPNHPLGLNIAGSPEKVRSFDQAATRRYHQQTFTASNLVIAAAGNLDHDSLVHLCRSIDAPSGSGKIREPTPAAMAAPFLTKQNANLEQAHLIISTPMVSAVDPRRYAADLLANILGGGTSSRLWQKIREERGLVYSVGASALMYQDCGLFSVSAAMSPANLAEVSRISVAEMYDIAAEGVTGKELELAKQQIEASILLSLEDSAARAATLASAEMIHGRQISLEESLKNLNDVRADEVKSLARENFVPEQMAFAALGDLKRLKLDRSMLDQAA